MHATEELQNVEERISKQASDHAKGMQEIQEQLGKHTQLPPQGQEPYEDGEADVEGESKHVMQHFQEDTSLSDLTPQHAEAVFKSVASLMSKKLERKQLKELMRPLPEAVVVSDENEELQDQKDGDEVWEAGKAERKTRRREAKKRADKDGAMNVGGASQERQQATKRENEDNDPNELARKLQNSSEDVEGAPADTDNK